jgi:hypothetical protein
MKRLKFVLPVAALALPAPGTLWGQDEEGDVEAATLAVEGMVSEEDVKLMIEEAVAAALEEYVSRDELNDAISNVQADVAQTVAAESENNFNNIQQWVENIFEENMAGLTLKEMFRDQFGGLDEYKVVKNLR